MRKSIMLVLLSLVMVIMLLAASCGKTEQTTSAPVTTSTSSVATSQAATASTTSSPATKVFEFKLSSHYPEDMTESWVKSIEEATGGRVKIIVYANSSLLDLKDTLSGLKNGIVDIALITPGTFPESYPLHNVLMMPFLPLGDQRDAYQVWQNLLDKFPELKAEFDGCHILVNDTSSINTLHTVKALAKTPADLKGLRVFSAIKINSDIMTDIGAVPLYLEVPDWFTSLDRGLMDGMWLPWDATWELKIYPLMPYHTSFSIGNGMMVGATLMRDEAWNSLPADLQKIISDLGTTERNRRWQALDNKISSVTKAVNETGGTIVELTQEEGNMWYEVARPRHEEYLNKLEANGLPAKAIYDEAIRLAQENTK